MWVTQKYPKIPDIPGNTRNTRKYPIVYFDTPTRPDPILKNPTRWALDKSLLSVHCLLINSRLESRVFPSSLVPFHTFTCTL